MGWLDDLRKWLSNPEPPAPGEVASPPPVFTTGPRPFGVGRDVAGVEWQTDKRTSALVRYRPAGTEAWAEVVDESRQRDHQRTLMGLTPDTEYQVEVTATVPRRGGGMVTQTITLEPCQRSSRRFSRRLSGRRRTRRQARSRSRTRP